MNADLEDTLRELGPGYREMVARMRRLGDRPPSAAAWRKTAYAAAAAAALAIGVAAVFVGAQSGGEDGSARLRRPAMYLLAYGGADAARELVGSQNADGSWANDFLTRQNAAALRGVDGASVAYRKALRYLRSKGLAPLTDEELRRRASLQADFAANARLAMAETL